MYVQSYAYTNVRTYLHLYECTYEYTLIQMWAYVRIYAYTSVRTNLRLYECVHTNLRLYECTYEM